MLGTAQRAASQAGDAVQGKQCRSDAAVGGGTRDTAAGMAYAFDQGSGRIYCTKDHGLWKEA